MKGVPTTKADADAHNARVEAEEALYAKLTPEERRRRMQARVSRKKVTEKQNDNPPRTEIPNPEQCERAPSLENRDEAKAQGASRVSKGAQRGFCRVSFTLRRVRLLDVDAAYASIKDLLDCCWISKLVDGDRPDQIGLEVRQEKVSSFKKEETLISLEIPPQYDIECSI